MPKNNHKRDPIPEKFASIEQAAEFWDTHDLTDYEDVWREVSFKVNLKSRPRSQVQLDAKIADGIAKRAKAKRMRFDALVNRVLSDYLKRAA